MAQVVDSSNLNEFIATGKVPEFKPPEAPKQDEKAPESNQQQTATAKTDAGKTDDDKAGEQARDEQGKFTKKADGDAKSEGPKPGDDEDGEQLTEKVRKIIGKKHRRMMEAEEFARERDSDAATQRARADAAEAELKRLRGEKSGGPAPEKQDGSDPDEPKPEDFKTVGEYTRALVKYEAAKAGKAGREKDAADKQQEQANATIQAFTERQDAFRKLHPDYDKIVEEADLEVPNIAMQYMAESELGPDLVLHLAQNPDEASRLRKLTSQTKVIARLGWLEAKLEAAKTPAPNNTATNGKAATGEVSKAPAPIAPLEARTTPVEKDPAKMSVQELRAHRRQEAIERSRAGR